MANLINGLGGPAGFGENFLDRNDDGFTGFIDVTSVFSSGLNFFDNTYSGFYINNNGNITFSYPSGTFAPYFLDGNTPQAIIAPFFNDIDTRSVDVIASPGGTSTGSNLVYYDLDPITKTVTVSWDDVGQFSVGTVPNAFQIILTDTGSGNFSIEFRYEDIQWQGGARAGYSAGNGADFFELPESGTSSILDLETLSNVGQAGIYRFNVVNTPSIILVGNDSDENLVGGDGRDRLNGGNGNDTLSGGARRDYLNGDLGNDSLNGNSGNDILDGAGDSVGLDKFVGGTGDDVYGVYSPNTLIIENVDEGQDSVWAAVSYTLAANVENMYLVGDINGTGNEGGNIISGYGLGDNNIFGLAGNDGLYGEEGNDYLNGGIGDDYLSGGIGNDILDGNGDSTGLDAFFGGDGDDTYGVYNSDTLIIENAGEGNDTVWAVVNYTLTADIENLYLAGALTGIGNGNNNYIIGYGADNHTMYGLGGNDYLLGGAGSDTIDGGAEYDYLLGGAGTDVFVLNTTSTDIIGDFAAGDKLQILASDFGGGLSAGTVLLSSQLRVGADAVTTNTVDQRFVFNSTNGDLFFDADGIASVYDPLKIGTLNGVTSLGVASFVIV
jgi:Ca2+-binding RTX toxin-like protein